MINNFINYSSLITKNTKMYSLDYVEGSIDNDLKLIQHTFFSVYSIEKIIVEQNYCHESGTLVWNILCRSMSNCVENSDYSHFCKALTGRTEKKVRILNDTVLNKSHTLKSEFCQKNGIENTSKLIEQI